MTSGSAPFGASIGEARRTPLLTYNRPGLAQISYRVGDYASFKDTMLESLALQTGLHTGETSDLSVALVDAFATMSDVLTFYQERIANESYLPTAKERRSALELARLIDYRPRPGVAASAAVAFTLEDAPGASDQAAQPLTIGARLKVQSLPQSGEAPLTFETIEDIEARPEWNAMRPLRAQPQTLDVGMQSVILSGANVDMSPGDLILVVAGDRDAKRVVKVTRDQARDQTRVDLAEAPPDPPPFHFPILPPWPIEIFFGIAPKLTNSYVSSNILGFSWRQHDFSALATVHKWSLPALTLNFARQVSFPPFSVEQGAFAFRQRAPIFGHNAPKYLALTNGQPGLLAAYPNNWDATPRTLSDDDPLANGDIYLDRTYPNVVAGSWAILDSRYERRICRVKEVGETSRADYGLSGKTTRLRVDSADGFSGLSLRETTVYVQSEQLPLADLPILDPVAGASVTLDRTYFGLTIGRSVVLTGARADLDGVVESEVLTLSDVTFGAGYTTLSFDQALANSYVRDSVTVNANVALATHGETVREILGSGDSSQPFQRFALRQSPLTYVNSDSASGARSTLEVRANSLLWRESPSFFGQGPNDRVYAVRIDDDGTAAVEFGDGVVGARLATGNENVQATYRKGGGKVGNVDAGRLSLLPVRPMGVRSAINPLAAAGATDAETLDEIRNNAALTVLTLDRIVSLSDYEDFARAFQGVGKALATWSWSGQRQGVFVTVAGAGGEELLESGQTYKSLLAAMRAAGDPHVSLRVQSYRQAFFRLSATIIVAADYEIASVLASVDAALRTAFSFDVRSFGQPATLSEAMATMQAVAGVVAVDIVRFFRIDDPNGGGIYMALAAAAPRSGDDGALIAAELLTLDPRPVDLVGALG
ncbi:putative baseplate assembly protein [Methylocapsa polymorpha]|uniref:Baseplate assembly protein n=1 Tax=Methylocapsa polymorpha TaxID=3080828 RepID=A0ABZ0HV51_9HYPH|nr:putative baseplate assembly protein [Methylocapsa sp. RX1]